ncbi:MAG: MBL fold metallo-hydrolase [Chitinispirillia bacterium]|nr:MBL fold metallo-hydrolase [Chitinispirillia bacterium]
MFRVMSFVALLSLLALNACNTKTSESDKQAAAATKISIEVLVVDDVPGREMDIDLFDGGPMTKEERLAFMPNGKAPAAVNVFVLKSGDQTYLIDAGFGNAVKDGRIDAGKVDAVFITHAHGDHISGLLKEDSTANFNAAVYISAPESYYWLNADTPNSALQKKIEDVYGNRYKTFAFGDTLVPGVVAIDASGHTPGHTAFLVDMGDKKMLVAGDFLHAAALQFPNPEECARFDMDRDASIKRRIELMQMCIDNNWLIAGIHIPGGFGTVKSNGDGGFEFTPYQ